MEGLQKSNGTRSSSFNFAVCWLTPSIFLVLSDMPIANIPPSGKIPTELPDRQTVVAYHCRFQCVYPTATQLWVASHPIGRSWVVEDKVASTRYLFSYGWLRLSGVWLWEGVALYFLFSFIQWWGLRYSVHLRMDLGKTLMMIAKFGHTYYFDRDVISSGNEQIAGKSKADLQLQMRLKW